MGRQISSSNPMPAQHPWSNRARSPRLCESNVDVSYRKIMEFITHKYIVAVVMGDYTCSCLNVLHRVLLVRTLVAKG